MRRIVRTRGRKLALATALLMALALGGVGFLLAPLAPIGAAFHAKVLCAGVFVSGREPSSIRDEDLDPAELSSLLSLVSSKLDRDGQRVQATFSGLVDREVVYRSGLGTTVVIGELADLEPPAPVPPPVDPAALWPQGERVDLHDPPGDLDRTKLEAALDSAFEEGHPAGLRRTRAVVVVWRGRIVAERYAAGFHASMPQLGWSMTKTIAGALVGVMVRDGRWSLGEPVSVPEWGPDDPRAQITLLQLLQMQSGLEFVEEYSPQTDVTVMLFDQRSAGAYAANKPLAHPPGTAWSYSSGTTNVICRAMQAELGADYTRFPREALFAPLGMTSALVEVDSAGHFVGSSFGWATARDWARFGLLWVQDGVWEGQRILPEGWVERCRRPAEHSGGRYGGHVWLRLSDDEVPELPADTFHAAGHDRQLLTMIPSRELVVLRLGLTRSRRAWGQEQLVAEVLDALAQ